MRKRLPRSVIVVALLCGLGLAGFAMSSPEHASGAWQGGTASAAWGAQPSGGLAWNAAQPVQTVAGIPGVPVIPFGAARPHADRGPCTNCHTVAQRSGAPVPNIHSFSVMPHSFRGVCGNCHQVTVSRSGVR